MAPANLEDKKGTKKKGGARTRQADAEEETQHNAELEMQIQGEIMRAQEGSSAPADAGGQEEVEIKDNIKMKEGGTNERTQSSVLLPHERCVICVKIRNLAKNRLPRPRSKKIPAF